MANRRGARWHAQQRGDTRYTGGVPCAKCGGLEKYTGSAKCVPCAHRENADRRRAAYQSSSRAERKRKYEKERNAVSAEVRALWAKRSRLRRKYGLTIEQRQCMLTEQAGTCAICFEAFREIGGLLTAHIDHDHATGKVRGLLCSSCNHALGNLRDNTELVRRAGLYLEGIREYD